MGEFQNGCRLNEVNENTPIYVPNEIMNNSAVELIPTEYELQLFTSV